MAKVWTESGQRQSLSKVVLLFLSFGPPSPMWLNFLYNLYNLHLAHRSIFIELSLNKSSVCILSDLFAHHPTEEVDNRCILIKIANEKGDLHLIQNL